MVSILSQLRTVVHYESYHIGVEDAGFEASMSTSLYLNTLQYNY